eukprot:gene19978-23908_t
MAGAYEVCLCPSALKVEFKAGDEVFVRLNRDKSTGRAVVLAPVITDPENSYHGRIKVQYHDSKTTYHVRPARISKVTTKRILVCYSTKEYRKLARTQLEPEDACLEIGCSWGRCTYVLAQQCRHVVGLDISQEAVEACRAQYPNLRFEMLDCLAPERLLEYAEGCSKVFVDIGGNRELEAVRRMISICTTFSPSVIVVKSQELYKHLETHPQGIFNDLQEVGPNSRVNQNCDELMSAVGLSTEELYPQFLSEESCSGQLRRLLLEESKARGVLFTASDFEDVALHLVGESDVAAVEAKYPGLWEPLKKKTLLHYREAFEGNTLSSVNRQEADQLLR